MKKYFAKLDENNLVVALDMVMDADAPNEEAGISFLKDFYKEPNSIWKQYDKHTVRNEQRKGGTPFRGNAATLGGSWDPENNVFWSRQPHNSWTKNMSNYDWEPPVAFPENLDGKRLLWNEELTRWEGLSGADEFYWDPNTSSWVAI